MAQQHNRSSLQFLILSAGVLFVDQLSKILVYHLIPEGAQILVIPGFFKLVHWSNTGAAWSLFQGKNATLAFISVLALVILIAFRRWFPLGHIGGRVALGLLFGGIAGNLIDRIRLGYVVDFLYFYVLPRGSTVELGFPAFNLADCAICLGVLLMIWITWVEQPAEEDQKL